MNTTELEARGSWWDRRRFHLLAGVLLLLSLPVAVGCFGIFVDSSYSILDGVRFLFSFLFIELVIWLTVWVWSASTDPKWRKGWGLGFAAIALAVLARLAIGDSYYRYFGRVSYEAAWSLVFVFAVSLFFVFFGGIGRWIGSGRGHARAGWWLGLLLGLILVPILILLVSIAWIVIPIALLIVFFGGIGRWIGSGKGQARAGWWFGLLLGPIGWIVVGLTSASSSVQAEQAVRNTMAVTHAINADMRTCPWCAESIKTAALICRYCNRELDPII